MANNINQIKAVIEANLATIRDAYYAALNSDSSPEGVKTARANYAAAIATCRTNAKQLFDNQASFTANEYEATNAVLELGYSLSKVGIRKFPTPTTADIGRIYGIFVDNSLETGSKLLTGYNTSIPLGEFITSFESLTGQSLIDFLSSVTVDNQPLARTIKIDVGIGASGGTADIGGTGATGFTGDCDSTMMCEDCCFTRYNQGPNGEITLEDGKIVYPFDPVTNPLGYVEEVLQCDKSHTRKKYIRCEGETEFREIEEPGLSAYHGVHNFSYQKVVGYEPKPYYDPDVTRDPEDPNIGRYQGPTLIGTRTNIDTSSKRCSFVDPITGKNCEIRIEEKCYCSSSSSLHFSNWGMKPCSWTPQWTDGPPPPGWCDAIRNYIKQHPELSICLPPECKNTVYTGEDETIFIPVAQ